MYAIEFTGSDNLEMRFNESIPVFVRGQMHCTCSMSKDLVNQCMLLFEKMIGKLKLNRPDVLWSKEIHDEKVVYKGLKVRASVIDNDILNFNHLKHILNTFMVHFKTNMGMNYKLVESGYQDNVVNIVYVLFSD